jgi:hypothetical protein
MDSQRSFEALKKGLGSFHSVFHSGRAANFTEKEPLRGL